MISLPDFLRNEHPPDHDTAILIPMSMRRTLHNVVFSDHDLLDAAASGHVTSRAALARARACVVTPLPHPNDDPTVRSL